MVVGTGACGARVTFGFLTQTHLLGYSQNAQEYRHRHDMATPLICMQMDGFYATAAVL